MQTKDANSTINPYKALHIDNIKLKYLRFKADNFVG